MRRPCPTLALAGAALSLLALTCAGAAAAAATPGAAGSGLLASIFQDHMVLQRDRDDAIWGRATAGEFVVVSFAGTTRRVQVDPRGYWQASVAAAAGGPYTLTVRADSGAQRIVNDVRVGDVYLCSGQSNMEMPVRAAANAAVEIAASGNESIRMVTIAPQASAEARSDFAAIPSWQVALPANVGDWSAACYFFARDLQPDIRVPVGLVSASWGGANIRPWISTSGFAQLPDYASDLQILALYAHDPAAAQQRYGAQWERSWRTRSGEQPGTEPWNPQAVDSGTWHVAPPGLGDYQAWGVPALSNFLGMLWYRTQLQLTAEEAAQPAWLDLGGVDEVDQTWLNGHVIGNSFGFGTERSYRIPDGVLRAGDNTLVVNVLNTYGAGGLVGDPTRRALRFGSGARVPLDGKWFYQAAAPQLGSPRRAPWESVGGIATLFNGMIAPLGAFGLSGVLWYQGESNTGEAAGYQALLAGLMSDWRRQFGYESLPFLIVQLPGFGARAGAPIESGWAALREAQRRAVAADARAALVVTIDIGEPGNLHPPGKQGVGQRAALAARKLIYGESVAAAGPQALSAALAGSQVVVRFRDDGGGLVSYSHGSPIAFELCRDAAGSCRFVAAILEGQQVQLAVPAGMIPTRVRYGWGDSPLCNLYDRGGLPAGPFELPVQQVER